MFTCLYSCRLRAQSRGTSGSRVAAQLGGEVKPGTSGLAHNVLFIHRRDDLTHSLQSSFEGGGQHQLDISVLKQLLGALELRHMQTLKLVAMFIRNASTQQVFFCFLIVFREKKILPGNFTLRARGRLSFMSPMTWLKCIKISEP